MKALMKTTKSATPATVDPAELVNSQAVVALWAAPATVALAVTAAGLAWAAPAVDEAPAAVVYGRHSTRHSGRPQPLVRVRRGGH